MKQCKLFVGAIVECKVSGRFVPCEVLEMRETDIPLYSRSNMLPAYGTHRTMRYVVRNRVTGRTITVSAARCRRMLGWKKSARAKALARGFTIAPTQYSMEGI